MYKKIFNTLLILSLSLIIVPEQVYAKKIIFSDNFEQNSLENWEVVRSMQWQNRNLPCMYFGEPALWKIQDGEIGIEIYGPECVTEIIPKNFNLNNVKNFEYIFDWNFKETIHADRNVIFLWKNSTNWYDFKITNNNILLQKIVDGVGYNIPNSQTDYSFEKDKKYHFSIQMKNNQIILSIDNNELIKADDLNPKIDGEKTLGLQASVGAISGSKSFFDNIVVYDLDAPDIKEAPLVKQNDSNWAKVEYDSASQWSDSPTIARWGCALTSMVMILKAHAISVMPGGEELNPATLNDWLKKQPDGYLSNGLLNWLAVTRLTKQLSSVLNTPALEYKRINYQADWLQKVIKQISEQKPVILELPGHFLVADSYTNDKSDLLIKDPIYSFNKFSQHNQEPQSIRTFTPSYTDLSHILLAVATNTNVELIDPNGASYSAELAEYIATPEEGDQKETTEKLKLISLDKPMVGEYLLTFSQDDFAPLQATIFTYDQNGEVKDLSLQTYVGQNPVVYRLDYTRSAADKISREADFVTFRQLVTELAKINEIKSPVAEIWLDYFASLAEVSLKENQLRYISLLVETINWFKNDLTSLANQVLVAELESIKANYQAGIIPE